jgi:hypothetical protein
MWFWDLLGNILGIGLGLLFVFVAAITVLNTIHSLLGFDDVTPSDQILLKEYSIYIKSEEANYSEESRYIIQNLIFDLYCGRWSKARANSQSKTYISKEALRERRFSSVWRR